MKAWFQSIRRCRNAQDLKCFGKKNTKKKKKKEKRKKERKKKGKAPRLGFESSSTRSGLTNLWCQLHKLWVVSSFPHAQGFAWRANVCSFSFSFFFFFVSLHLRRTSPKGKGLLVVYQRQKCFLKHENHGWAGLASEDTEKGAITPFPPLPVTFNCLFWSLSSCWRVSKGFYGQWFLANLPLALFCTTNGKICLTANFFCCLEANGQPFEIDPHAALT